MQKSLEAHFLYRPEYTTLEEVQHHSSLPWHSSATDLGGGLLPSRRSAAAKASGRPNEKKCEQACACYIRSSDIPDSYCVAAICISSKWFSYEKQRNSGNTPEIVQEHGCCIFQCFGGSWLQPPQEFLVAAYQKGDLDVITHHTQRLTE